VFPTGQRQPVISPHIPPALISRDYSVSKAGAKAEFSLGEHSPFGAMILNRRDAESAEVIAGQELEKWDGHTLLLPHPRLALTRRAQRGRG
jgi:hypothetical protein